MQKAPFYNRIQRISEKSSDLFSCPSTPSLSSLLSKKPREQDLQDEDETQSNCQRRSTIPAASEYHGVITSSFIPSTFTTDEEQMTSLTKASSDTSA